MKPQDLRIGNYLQNKDSKRRFIINEINADEYTVMYDPFREILIKSYLARFDPIPVTQEILERAGFEVKSHSAKLTIKDENIIYYNFGAKCVLINNQVTPIYIKGFHHLQNVIYFLFGYELSLNEKIENER